MGREGLLQLPYACSSPGQQKNAMNRCIAFGQAKPCGRVDGRVTGQPGKPQARVFACGFVVCIGRSFCLFFVLRRLHLYCLHMKSGVEYPLGLGEWLASHGGVIELLASHLLGYSWEGTSSSLSGFL